MKKRYLIFFIISVLCAAFLLCGCTYETVDPEGGELREDGTRVYSVPNAYFVFEKYNVITKSPTDIGDNFSVITNNTLEIQAKCGASLDEVVAFIKLYDADGRLVGNYRCSMTNCGIEENESFTMTTEISNDAKNAFSVVDVRFEGKSLKKVFRVDNITYNVTYVYNNGTPPTMVVAKLGDLIKAPTEIPQKDGYIFSDWFTDPACTEPYDFSNSEIESDLTLYAGYMLNYIRMGQKLVDVAKLSTVKITTKSYSSLLWGTFETASTEKSGEGIIIKDSNGYYSILTTNDLLKKEDGYDKVEYRISDYYGNNFVAELKHSSEAYNLGILRFEKNNSLLVAQLSPVAPKVGNEVGMARYFDGSGYYPYFGKILSFEKISHEDIGSAAHDITFDMLVHDVQTDGRISGRPMFNMNLELIGLQCGTLTKDEVELESKHVIPWDAIKKYIDTHGN